MKTLIFSDTHILSTFEKPKYDLLKSIIEPVDQVIINGDFWDGYFTTFKKFKNSQWSNLFPLLKEKNAIYLYGNHDKSNMMDSDVNLFSNIQKQYHRINLGSKVLVVEHGNRLMPFFDEDPSRRYSVDGVAMRVFGEIGQGPAIKLFGGKALKLAGARYNRIIKRKVKKYLHEDEIYVCGHTHAAEFNPRRRFINSGLIRHGLAQYVLIENNDITLVEQKYH